MYIGHLCFLFCEMPFVHVLTGYLFKLNIIYIYLFLLIYMSFKHFILIFVLYFPLWFLKNELKFLISSAQIYQSFILYVVLKKKKTASWGHKGSILHFFSDTKCCLLPLWNLFSTTWSRNPVAYGYTCKCITRISLCIIYNIKKKEM